MSGRVIQFAPLAARLRVSVQRAEQRQREQRDTFKTCVVISAEAEELRREYQRRADCTARDECHVCGYSLNAEQFCAWDRNLIVTHGDCT